MACEDEWCSSLWVLLCALTRSLFIFRTVSTRYPSNTDQLAWKEEEEEEEEEAVVSISSLLSVGVGTGVAVRNLGGRGRPIRSKRGAASTGGLVRIRVRVRDRVRVRVWG